MTLYRQRHKVPRRNAVERDLDTAVYPGAQTTFSVLLSLDFNSGRVSAPFFIQIGYCFLFLWTQKFLIKSVRSGGGMLPSPFTQRRFTIIYSFLFNLDYSKKKEQRRIILMSSIVDWMAVSNLDTGVRNSQVMNDAIWSSDLLWLILLFKSSVWSEWNRMATRKRGRVSRIYRQRITH